MNRAERRRSKQTAPRGQPSGEAAWGEWQEGRAIPKTEAEITALAAHAGVSRAVVADLIAEAQQDLLYLNDIYQVQIRRRAAEPPFPEVLHLSIKRRDQQPVGKNHWRDFQRIKNELVGPDHEAVELYPAEERLVDAANQYHLWVMADPSYRFPFGFQDRLVRDTAVGGAVQAPYETGNPSEPQEGTS